MTEEEARIKLCPLFVAGFYAGGSMDSNTGCAASDCMMWVEEEKMVYKEGSLGPEFVKTGHGYCGLAG